MLGRILRCRRGATAVEAALVLPLVITFVLGVIEFSLLFFTVSSMQTAARDIARQVAINAVSPATAETAIIERIPDWARDGLNVDVKESAPGDPEKNVITLRLSMAASAATPLPLFSYAAGGWDVATEVEMKQELPFVELEGGSDDDDDDDD